MTMGYQAPDWEDNKCLSSSYWLWPPLLMRKMGPSSCLPSGKAVVQSAGDSGGHRVRWRIHWLCVVRDKAPNAPQICCECQVSASFLKIVVW